MAFKDFFISFAIIGILVFAIFSFIITFQNDQDFKTKITDDALINNTFGSLQKNLRSMGDNATSQKEVFESETPTRGFGSLVLYSIVSTGKVFTGMIFGTFNILIKLPVNALGMSEELASVLVTITIILSIIGLWVLYKIGG